MHGRRPDIEEQRPGRDAATALEHVDTQLRCFHRETDTQGCRRRVRGARGTRKHERRGAAVLRRELQPVQALIANDVRPEQQRAGAVGTQHLLGCPPAILVLVRGDDDHPTGSMPAAANAAQREYGEGHQRDPCAAIVRDVQAQAAQAIRRCLRRRRAIRSGYLAATRRRQFPVEVGKPLGTTPAVGAS
jgi:hypothetical protein